jgi:hypothetical protein
MFQQKITKGDIIMTKYYFKNNLANQQIYTRTAENLISISSNIVYEIIKCTQCGLIYLGKTKGSLNKHMSCHKFEFINGGLQLLYKL